ncbi:MAG: hypothetical protein ABSG41_08855 [Bryobacteraceae bacterium]|jgi:hypothetical protein
MRTNLITAFLLTGALLFAQTSGNVTFSTSTGGAISGGAIAGGFAGVLGAPGPQTFAFVAGELSGNTVKGAPYSAQASTQTTQTLADGNQIVNTTTASIYRDADGRERREQSLPNIGPFAAQDAPVQTIFISDPVAGVNYSLNPSEHVAIKLPAPPSMGNASGKMITLQRMVTSATPGMPPGMPMPNAAPTFIYRSTTSAAPNPPVVEQLGTQSIQGVQAEGTRTTFTIPAGQIGNSQPIQIVDEVWRSLDLQVIVQSTHSDPRMGTTSYALSNISRTDPSPALFQVPADYTIKDEPAMNIQKFAIPAIPATPQ